jgi:glycerol-1-phosphatase
MLDLDGVVYIGPHAVTGVAGFLEQVRHDGVRLAFVTNNASRTPEMVATHLTTLGVRARPAEVITSAQAAVGLLTNVVRPRSAVLVMGGPGIEAALSEHGFAPVTCVSDKPEAVITGYGPDITWKQMMLAAVQIKAGLPWIAANADLTIPTEYGIGPGHGVVVKMLQDFSGAVPAIAGKPEKFLVDEAVARMGGNRPLMVGDRLDTDILGAHNAGVDSLLVLTGVTGLPELVAATRCQRPTYLSQNLHGLLRPHPAIQHNDDTWQVSNWLGRVTQGQLKINGHGHQDDWWRCVASVAWAYLDDTGETVTIDGLSPPVPDL